MSASAFVSPISAPEAEGPVALRAGRTKAPPPRLKAVSKSETAYRTIAEVAAELGVATHVLRFWEGKFPVLQPMKQRGGRRFYRPDDVALLRYIQKLLYTEGYTIRGVQAVLKQMKPKDVKALTQTLTLPQVVVELQAIRQVLEPSSPQSGSA